ncbi:MAG TPA: hypothetical protein VJ436_05610 [Anaerolineales bacterium]|nr:hypothetical protein [Anaerolineales bacterium]
MRAIILTSTLALLGLACQAVSLPAISPALSMKAAPGSLLFQDDFSDPASGWDRQILPGSGVVDYYDGALRILVSSVDEMLWSGPGLEFSDVRIEVQASRLSGPEDNLFGIVCRATDRENFYFLAISSDGYYGIGKVKEGVQSLIANLEMPPHDAIIQGEASNHLRADCSGSHLRLMVNGAEIAAVEDPEFTSGQVGLLAGSFSPPGVDIRFDNFMVLQP